MPVILEQISEPCSQDYTDLVKIYQDDSNLTGGNPNRWIDEKLKSGQKLLAGRFNGRIVGCIWAMQASGHWQLQHLAVRDITRRRGVARQLLTLLTKQAQKQNVDLSAQNNPACDMIRPLLMDLGFTLATSDQSAQWQKKHQP